MVEGSEGTASVRRRPRLSVSHLFCGLLLGCTSSDGAVMLSVSTDTVGGVEVVVSNISGPEPPAPWAIEVQNAVIIGTVDGPEETRFGRLAAVAVSPLGDIYIADGQARTIRVFDGSGTYVRSIGREGEGPGEFRSIDGVAHGGPQGGFYVRDPLMNRVSEFNSSGVFVHAFDLSRPFVQISRRTSLWVDGRGQIHDFTHIGSTMSVDSLAVVSYTGSGSVVDTTVVSASFPRRLLLRGADGQPRAAMQVPFAAFGMATVAGTGQVIGGTGAAYEFKVFEQGRLVRTVRKEEAPLALPSWAADTVEARARELREGEPNGSVDRDALPEAQPYYNVLIADPLGFVWVGREGQTRAPTGRYDVFGPNGEFVGVVDVPPMLIDQVGVDFIAGRMVDELGVERVSVMGLVRH